MSTETWSLTIIVGTALLLVALERVFPYDAGQRIFRRGFFTDLVMYGLLQSWVMGIVIAQVIATLDRATGWSTHGLVSRWPLALQCLFFFVAHDLYIYGFHRCQHRFDWLWRTHEAHHSVTEIDWVAGSRSHALEILINQTIEFAPIVLLGAAPEVAIFKATIDAVWGMWIHSNVGVKTGWLQYVINGPEMHRWHHARDIGIPGKNFSTKIALWDWLFGTAYLPGHDKPAAYGLDPADGFPEGYFAQFAALFRRR